MEKYKILKVTAAEYVDGYCLMLSFNNGESRVVDFASLMQKGICRKLQDVDYFKSILDILKVGTSAGGAKPKAIIAYHEGTGEVRSGQAPAPEEFTYWLLKFDGGTTFARPSCWKSN